MKKFLKKNLAMIIIIGILLVAGSILGIAIYKVANRVEPELIVKDNIVLSYAGSAEEVQIDESVQSIATGAFKGKATIKKVVFANNAKIKSIGINAFQQCGSLVDIVLPKGLELIGSHAFEGCVSLENIVIPEGVKRIEAGTFSGCASLKSVYLPTSLEYIAEDAFFNCPQLSNITCKSEKFDFANGILFNKDHTVIYKYLSTNTSTKYTVPNTVTEIKAYAFHGAENLIEVCIGKNVEKIGTEILSNCSKIEKIEVPFLGATASKEDAGTLGYLFGKVPTKLKEVTVSGGEIIANQAFYFTTVTKITIGEGVKMIGENAFKQCTSLQYVYLPSSIKTISAGAFTSCNKKCQIIINQTERDFGTDWNPLGLTVIFNE